MEHQGLRVDFIGQIGKFQKAKHWNQYFFVFAESDRYLWRNVLRSWKSLRVYFCDARISPSRITQWTTDLRFWILQSWKTVRVV
jgi:hypothetical protein